MSVRRSNCARAAFTPERRGEKPCAQIQPRAMTAAVRVTSKRQKSVSFIVRLWHEGGEAPRDGGGWRGCVEAVDTEEKMYFDNLSDFCKFLEIELQKLGVDS